MKTPRLTRKLVLEEAQRTPDGAGGFGESWVALGTHWAEIGPGTGREKAEGLLTLSSVPMKITVRATPHGAPSRPRPEQRFREGARLFRILAVIERVPGGRYLICHAREEVAT